MDGSRFATLPIELRDQIWELVLTNRLDDAVIINQVQACTPAISRTCRQIRSESLVMFYQKKIFKIVIHAVCARHLVPTCSYHHSWLRLYDEARLLERWLDSVPSECHFRVPSLHIINEIWGPGFSSQWHRQEDTWVQIARKLECYGYTDRRLDVSAYFIAFPESLHRKVQIDPAQAVRIAFGKVGLRVTVC